MVHVSFHSNSDSDKKLKLLVRAFFFLVVRGFVSRQDKYVVFGPDDNLGRIAKQHDVTVADIVKWNGIQDPRQLRVGVRLIVQKGAARTTSFPVGF